MPNFTYDLPKNYYFGGGGDTFAPPLAVVVLIAGIILILALPRKYALIPFLLATLWIPAGVAVVVSGLHFNASRLLLLAGWIRLLTRKEGYTGQLNPLDKAIVFGTLVNSVAYVLVWREFGALVNRLGALCTTLGSYFLLRSLLRSKEDVIRTIKVLAIAVTIVAPLMWREHVTQHNTFSLLGAPELSEIRYERVRAQGPFDHPIIAGTFGVVLVPLFAGLWWYNPRNRFIAIVGIVSSVVMMICCASSTPVMSLPAGLLALSMWPLRAKMQTVRRAIVVMLICIQLVMKSPIWFLIDRVSGVLGGSGWHRAMLIDNFVRHFFEWCLIGTNNNPNWGWSMWDVDNAYVGAGLMGGLLGVILFLAVLVYAYRTIGVARRAARSSKDARLIWAIGAALFANTIAFFGIVFFDQSIVAWYALLVMVQATPAFVLKERPQVQLADVMAQPGISQPVASQI